MFSYRLGFAVFFISICGLVFYLGYSFGSRPLDQSDKTKVEVNLPNKFVENSLTQIQIRPILGVFDSSGKPREVGKMYFVVNKENQTELLFRIENIPNQQQGNLKNQNIPTELGISLARRNTNGSDYDYEQIGIMTMVQTGQNTNLSGSFSTILEYDILSPRRLNVSQTSSNLDNQTIVKNILETANNPVNNKVPERLEFFAVDKNNVNTASIFTDTSINLPINIRGDQRLGIEPRPAPFFWVQLEN